MPFAKRTGWAREENALARATAAARQSPRFIDLTASNPTVLELPYAKEEILRALSAPSSLVYAPSPLGLRAAREAVAAYYGRRGIAVDAEQVVLVASTSEAYGFAFRLLLDAGDVVAMPKPSYPLLDFLASLADAETADYRLRYDGRWYLDGESLAASAGERTRAIVVVSPNNPTGSCLDAAERARVLACGLPIIADEVFADYAGKGHGDATWIGRTGGVLALSMNGLSKVAGLPGHKLGWIVLHGPEAEVAEARARLEIIADTYLSVATPVQVALPTLLALADPWQAALRERIARNRTWLESEAARRGRRLRHADGGWYAMLDLPRTRTDESWALRFLEEDHLLTHPAYLFDLDAATTTVLSLILAPERFEEGVTRLLSRLEED